MINCRMHMKLREVIATPKTIEKLNRWKRDIQNLTAGSYRPYLTVWTSQSLLDTRLTTKASELEKGKSFFIITIPIF